VSALFGKTICHLDELPSAVRQTVGKNRLQLTGQIPREGIAHLNRRRQFRRPPDQHIFEVLAGVAAASCVGGGCESLLSPITADVFSVLAPKSILRSRWIVVFLSPTNSAM
jgi:hypothetical protein